MKIHQLPLGARFEYQGIHYVKTGPLIASGDDGRQRLIPKHALLKVSGDYAPPPAPPREPLSPEAVLRAFEAYHAACRPLVAEADQARLEAAREAFLKSLG